MPWRARKLAAALVGEAEDHPGQAQPGAGGEVRREGGERVPVLHVGRHHPDVERVALDVDHQHPLATLDLLVRVVHPRAALRPALDALGVDDRCRRPPLRSAARQRQATWTASARSSSARSRQRRSRLHTLWCGGKHGPTGSRCQTDPSRARRNSAPSMVTLDQSRGRTVLQGGSIVSIVTASRTRIPCRNTSWIAVAYLRRSSAVHAISRFLRQLARARSARLRPPAAS